MTRKIIVCLIIMTMSAGTLFSQDKITEEAFVRPMNTVAFNFSIVSIGAAVNYEKHFNNHLSVLGDASLSVIPPTITIAAKGRLYPFGKAFFLEMGLGFGMTYGYLGGLIELTMRSLTFGFLGINQDFLLKGVVLTPALGWNIWLGKQGTFKLPISLGIDFFVGYREFDVPVDFVPNFRIGFGYSF